MSFISAALDEIAKQVTGYATIENKARQKERDLRLQNRTLSVESIVSDTLANLTCSGFAMPISGQSERAQLMNKYAERFAMDDLPAAMSLGFATGDCLVVPMWTGNSFVNALVPRDHFKIINAQGDRITAAAYVADEREERNSVWQLIQVMELETYTAQDESLVQGCHYTLRLAKDGKLRDEPVDKFPEWAGYERDWTVPNVDRLLLGRFKNFTRDKTKPNNEYGVPLCFGASQPISEIHFLLDQLHAEFELGQKAVFADKSLFVKDAQGNLKLPERGERLFMTVRGSNVDSKAISEWSPTIQNTPYEEALETAKRNLEHAINVDSGILSRPNETNYENVDNVRKSTRKTQAFINHARSVADGMMRDITYSWDKLMNYYGLVPGDYEVQHKWSDEYINTFSDMRESLVAGYSMGATDALDYRLFVLGEAPEVARQRVLEIQASRTADVYAEE